MDVKDIAKLVKEADAQGKKMAMFQYQVLVHADELKGVDATQFCKDIKVPKSYALEFKKMIRLAELMEDDGLSLKKGRIQMGKRDDYLEKMKNQLDEWNAKLNTLEEKASDLKEKYADELNTLSQKRDTAKQKLAEIQKASGGAWEEMKVGMDEAWSSLKDAFEKARERFKND